jgi:histidinol dehydrogenase
MGWRKEMGGLTLGSRVTPLASVGIYVPAGQAPLPSSLYMCAVPAAVAGVPRVVVCSPPRRDGSMDALTLVAARETGVGEVYRLGGAQAIAALAYGTETVTPVVKIVGPGNRWVVEAKRQVFGVVGIESLPGPSESALIADDSADPELVAADLLSQAEHAGENMVVLLTPSERLADAALTAIPGQMAALARAELIGRSLQAQGAVVLVRDLAQAAALVSELAPEHLELAVAAPEALAERIENAGCIFLGHRAAVPLGDYAAGPSHVLPTGGTARFSSPLSVQDFVKRTSLVGVSEEGLRRIGPDVIALAEAEGLTAHAEAVRKRLR